MFRVANLDNLFWDNGSFKYPNTYPKLVDGENPKKTPVMTSPTTGWVILEGDWNYCQFNDDLFFLKKSSVISHKRNKWVYILIKDHICSLFKNKSNIIVKGTLINTDLNKLRSQDFQFTFPVFNSYNKRILIPLLTEPFNWRKHGIKKKITKVFPCVAPITDRAYSEFVAQLEANKDLLTKSPKRSWAEVVKENNYLVLLGRLGSVNECVKGWKQELVEKINEFLDTISDSDDIVLGVITNSNISNATKLNGRYAISYRSNNPVFNVSKESKEIDIDLSGLTDIELINFDNASSGEKYSKDYFNLFLSYNVNYIRSDFFDAENTFVYKLSRRVRIPFTTKSSTRAITKSGGRHYTFAWEYNAPQISLCHPQKVFFKSKNQLTLKGTLEDTYPNYPTSRKQDNFRSVYLYWCFNLNFYFTWGKQVKGKVTSYNSKTWINGTDYFKDVTQQNVLRSISGDRYFKSTDERDIEVIPNFSHLLADMYESYFPWAKSGRLTEPLNIGWLLGQFSLFLEGQDKYFETIYPFIVRSAVNTRTQKSLKRLKGLKESVADLISLEDLYEESSHKKTVFTLDIFNPLSRRMREQTPEEDFLIGEKLLFTTWGMAPYLLFQPTNYTYDRQPTGKAWTINVHLGFAYLADHSDNLVHSYGYYSFENLDDGTNYQLFGKWVNYSAWHYPYVVFDAGASGAGYLTPWAKQWWKKGYDNYNPLDYDNTFYQKDTGFKKLKTHITKNTEAYFVTEDVDFTSTSLQELKVNDIFYSDLEWFWFNANEGQKFTIPSPADFITHEPDLTDVKQLREDDVVVWLNPKDKKLYLGKVHTWEDNMTLPENQFVINDGNVDNYSSTDNSLKVTYTRFTPLTTEVATTETSFDSIDVLIDTLKRSRFMKKIKPNSLKELQDTGRHYLFNLKGTPFLCVFDRLGRVSLVFKNKEFYEESEHIPD